MKASLLSLLSLPFIALSAHAEGGYTNHAGNMVAGWPVKLTATQVTLAERATPAARLGHRALPTADHQPPATNHQPTATYPLSIFPESERRRIAADFGWLRGSNPADFRVALHRHGILSCRRKHGAGNWGLAGVSREAQIWYNVRCRMKLWAGRGGTSSVPRGCSGNENRRRVQDDE